MKSNDQLIAFLKELIDIGLKKRMWFYFVGGCVRDAFFGVSTTDIDIALDGNVDVLFSTLETRFDVKKSMFGTLSLAFEGIYVDIAGFRQEVYHDDSGLPQVSRGTLEADLNRRDFTINTGYVRLDQESIKILLAGRAFSKEMVYACHAHFFDDLDSRKLRTLKKNSFSEDATRMLRAVKYLVVHQLVFESETEKQFLECITAKWHDRCSEDRYKKILLSFATHEYWKPLLSMVGRYGLFQRNISLDRPFENYIYERLENFQDKIGVVEMGIIFLMVVYENDLSYWFNAPRRIAIHAKQCKNIGERIEASADILACHELMRKASKETLAFFYVSPNCNKTLRRYVDEELWDIELEISGKDLIEMGIAEGAKIGKVMNDLLKHSLQKGRKMGKLEELKWVESRINEYRD